MKKKTSDLPGEPGQDGQVLRGWMVECKHIQSGGLVGEKKATEAELREVCNLLELDELVSLSCQYDFSPYERRRYALSCEFFAELKQKSIYSLKPVVQKIGSHFKTELFLRRDEEEGGQFYLQDGGDVLSGTDEDFFNGEVIELGRLVYEFLSLELDQFSRDEGETDVWRAEHKKQSEQQKIRQSPFAVLQALPHGKKEK